MVDGQLPRFFRAGRKKSILMMMACGCEVSLDPCIRMLSASEMAEI